MVYFRAKRCLEWDDFCVLPILMPKRLHRAMVTQAPGGMPHLEGQVRYALL